MGSSESKMRSLKPIHSPLLRAAGVVNIVAGAALLVATALIVLDWSTQRLLPSSDAASSEQLARLLVLPIMTAGMAAASGVLAVREQYLGLAIAGFVISLVLIPGLGLTASILAILSKRGWSSQLRALLIVLASLLGGIPPVVLLGAFALVVTRGSVV